MEMNNRNLLFLMVTLTLFSICTFAQSENKNDKKFSKIVPNYTELRIIHSNIIEDDYYLYVKLPNNYQKQTKHIPLYTYSMETLPSRWLGVPLDIYNMENIFLML